MQSSRHTLLRRSSPCSSLCGLQLPANPTLPWRCVPQARRPRSRTQRAPRWPTRLEAFHQVLRVQSRCRIGQEVVRNVGCALREPKRSVKLESMRASYRNLQFSTAGALLPSPDVLVYTLAKFAEERYASRLRFRKGCGSNLQMPRSGSKVTTYHHTNAEHACLGRK